MHTRNLVLLFLKESSQQYLKLEKLIPGLTEITKEAWNTTQNAEDKREKIHPLSLAKECYSINLELLINATVTDGTIKFVSRNLKVIHIYFCW